MTIRTTLAIAAALLTTTLGACSRSNDEPAPAEERVEAPVPPAPVAVDTPDLPDPLPTPSATPDTNLAAEAPPAVDPGPDEQMMDDASATGMTARASRDEPAAADTAPVEQK